MNFNKLDESRVLEAIRSLGPECRKTIIHTETYYYKAYFVGDNVLRVDVVQRKAVTPGPLLTTPEPASGYDDEPPWSECNICGHPTEACICPL